MKRGEVIPAHCPSKAFADLNTDRWYHEYTDYVIARELMNGMDETHFAPGGNLTRGQLVTTLYRLAGEPEVTEKATFTDLRAGAYYADAVAWAQDLGIAKGMTETPFAPGENRKPGADSHLPVPVCDQLPEAGAWSGSRPEGLCRRREGARLR